MFATLAAVLLLLFFEDVSRAQKTQIQRPPLSNALLVWDAACRGISTRRRMLGRSVAAVGLSHRWSTGWRNAGRHAGWSALLCGLLLIACASHGLLAQESSLIARAIPNSGTSPPPTGPPEPETVFADPGAPPAFYQAAAPQYGSPSGYPRRMPWGNGHVMIADPAEFPRIKAFDHHEPGSLWDNMRPNLFGQEVTDEWDFYNLINTDRMDFTDASYSAGKGVTIIESGYTFTRNNDPSLHVNRRTLPEVLTRIGITDEFELRMKWIGYVMTEVTDQTSGLRDSYFGGSDLQLGFKYELLQQDDWRPMVTFLGESFVPTGTGGVSANALQPRANVVLGWGFRRWLYLKMSTGVDFLRTTDVTQVINGIPPQGPIGIHGVDNNATWHQSASLLYQATKRVGGFFEWYSFFSNNSADNRAQHYLDTGFYIYVTPNVQLDVRVGERVSDRVDGLFSGAGFSVRF